MLGFLYKKIENEWFDVSQCMKCRTIVIRKCFHLYCLDITQDTFLSDIRTEHNGRNAGTVFLKWNK